MSFVGATLKFSPSVSPSNVAPKYSAILSGLLEDTKRPHMPSRLELGPAAPRTPRQPPPTPSAGTAAPADGCVGSLRLYPAFPCRNPDDDQMTSTRSST